MLFNKSHLQMLDERARDHGAQPVFWVPKDGNPGEEWIPVTYAQHHAHVHDAKRYYKTQLAEIAPTGAVVAVWGGCAYADFVATLGVAAAGYIPQLSSPYAPGAVVFKLIEDSGAKALVVDSPERDTAACPLKVINIMEVKFDAPVGPFEPLGEDKPFEEFEDAIAVIVHSSGSTGKVPKLIPWTHSWISGVFGRFEYTMLPNRGGARNEVFSSICDFSNSAVIQYFGCLSFGASLVVPSMFSFTSEELLNQIRCCGLNRLTLLTSRLQFHLEHARNNPLLLEAIKDLDSISYGGSALAPDMEAWCQQAGLKLMARFANTECGVMMTSTYGDAPSCFRPIPNLSHIFVPAAESDQESEANLLELVILPDSPGFPHSSLIRTLDGRFHTGDLFERTRGGAYIFRGRKDDWIKVGHADLCDTRLLEDAVRNHCNDIISDCVVVGSNRPRPALLVERHSVPAEGNIPDMIVKRLSDFNMSRLPHERLDDPRLVVVVNSGALPRTAAKRNIRRNLVEELYSDILTEMYANRLRSNV